ncbi:hypothetical protein DFH08DRAFT_960016 [Mycena albidolilacea]|uniref:Uncharacterized protein n=1 Tax=Mycena albidolilacea TaxID=1033008 RepID=A0AAD7A477_9AGAR|nr:hypothetical protein DFH08DRAFT_960016 [Mycena albidolilacea]
MPFSSSLFPEYGPLFPSRRGKPVLSLPLTLPLLFNSINNCTEASQGVIPRWMIPVALVSLAFVPRSSRLHFASLTSAVVLVIRRSPSPALRPDIHWYSMAVRENPVLHVPALITTLPPSFPPSRFSPA